jgi:hypothetical protein
MVLLKHRHLVIPLSVVCLTLSALLGRFPGDGARWIDFLGGLFLGLAFSLSIFGLITSAVMRGYE